MEKNLEEKLNNILSEIPWKKESVIQHASSFLSDCGIITDFHKNTMVIGIALESKAIKKTEFFIKNVGRDENGFILIYLYVNRWFYVFGRKKGLAERVISKVHDLCPLYDVSVKFLINRKRGNNNDSQKNA